MGREEVSKCSHSAGLKATPGVMPAACTPAQLAQGLQRLVLERAVHCLDL